MVIMGIVLVLMETNGPCGSQLVIGESVQQYKIHFKSADVKNYLMRLS